MLPSDYYIRNSMIQKRGQNKKNLIFFNFFMVQKDCPKKTVFAVTLLNISVQYYKIVFIQLRRS